MHKRKRIGIYTQKSVIRTNVSDLVYENKVTYDVSYKYLAESI